jgi:hypothetical protein
MKEPLHRVAGRHILQREEDTIEIAAPARRFSPADATGQHFVSCATNAGEMPLLRLGCGQYSGQAYSENDQGDRSTSKENASRCRYARLRRGAPLPRPDQSFARRRCPRRGRASGPVGHRTAAARRDGARHEPATHDAASGMETATETRPYDQRTIVAWCRQAWTMKHKRLFLRFWPRGRPMDQYVRARSLGR